MDKQAIRDRLAASVGGEARFAESFSARTMRDLQARAKRELDDGAELAFDALDRIGQALRKANLVEHSEHDPEAFVERFVRLWSAYQAAGARTANWTATGPARFPVRQNEKRMDTEHRRYLELDAFTKAAPSREVKAAERRRNQALGADGMASEELADLRGRLEKREASQRQMKATNEMIRRHKLKAGDGARLSELMTERGFPMNPNLCGMLLQPDYGRAGFASYQLSNNNAEIKRLKVRAAEVERKLARIETGAADEREVNGVRIVEDAADDRLRLFFEGKPEPQIISALKSRGFRWSPRAGAWQRQLTQNARYAAEGIVAQIAA